MANKKKKTSRPASRRRGRVSGFGGANTQELLGLALGAVAVPYVDDLLEKAKITDNKIKAAIKAGAAIILLPKLSKSPMVKSVGNGMIAVSALQLAASLKLYKDGAGIGATDDDIYVDMSSVSGVDDVINGVDLNVINGMDEDNGY